MIMFQFISVLMGILVITAIVVNLCITQKNNLLTSLASGLLFAVALFTTLHPVWWTIAITICLLTVFIGINLKFIKSSIASMFGIKIISCCLALYAIELAISITILATNWCWYIALIYIPIAIALVIIGLFSAVGILTIAVAMATRS